MKEVHDLAEAQALALAIVDTLPEPFLVLDDTLHLLAGSRCFYEVFGRIRRRPTAARCSTCPTANGTFRACASCLRPWFPQTCGGRGFRVRARLRPSRQAHDPAQRAPHSRREPGGRMVLLAIKDITERRVAEQEKQRLLEHTEELLEQQRTLLREMRHRIANSLQIIASILLLKAGSVSSEETKNELRAAHQRVMSVATVQGHLQASDGIEQIEMGPYLEKLSARVLLRQWSDRSRTSTSSLRRPKARCPPVTRLALA